jgi:hypothetical protein
MKCEKCGLDRRDMNHIELGGKGVLVLNADGVVIERLREHWNLCCDGVLIGPDDYDRYHESYKPQIPRTVKRKMEIARTWATSELGECPVMHFTWDGPDCKANGDSDCEECDHWHGDDCGAETYSTEWEAVDPTYTFKTWK